LAVFGFSYACRVAGFLKIANRFLTVLWDASDNLSLVTTSCIPHAATATATVDHGFVVAATIIDGGCGYTNTPAVLIRGCGGTGATATAIVTNGVVVGITITDAGTGYTCTPNIYISSPLGMEIVSIKAVKPSFLNLSLGTNYQMQISGNMNTWTNYGAPFKATNTTMIYPQYFDVDARCSPAPQAYTKRRQPVDYSHSIRRAEVDRGCVWVFTWEGSLDALRTVPRAMRVEHLEAKRGMSPRRFIRPSPVPCPQGDL
jgi:hypothetical protein